MRFLVGASFSRTREYAALPGLALAPSKPMSTWQIVRADERIELTGELRLLDAPRIWRRLGEAAARPGEQLDLDLHDAQLIDGAIMALLVDLRASLIAQGTRSAILGAPERIQSLVHLYRGDQPPAAAGPPPAQTPPALARFGDAVARALRHARAIVVFAGQLAGALVADVRHINWREVPTLIARAGTDGIPVVLLLDFLVGFVMAYQSTRQLQIYGVSLYVADIVGLSVTRELSPLVTAIIVAGRSGAAYAAELGTMCVSEEVDALRTMGFSPIAYLVAPRTIALAVVTPVLTLLGDVVGVGGGLVVGMTSLGITPHAYINELRTLLELSDVWTGLVKSATFGVAIALIGCRQGLATRGAARAVGRSTTATVVSCLFAIVILDTVWTVIFRGLEL
jgi:phospholipid/cholesterol/gamma-HCH transport system permease protein